MTRFLPLLLLLGAAPLASAQGAPNSFGLHDIPISPYEVGVGGAVSFSPTENPYAAMLNPALLADAGRRPGVRFGASIAPNTFGSDNLLIGSSAFTIGLRSSLAGRPLQIGLGGSYTEFNVDNTPFTDDQGNQLGDYDTAERASGGGLGIGWDGPVHVRIGAAATYREGLETPPIDFGQPASSRDRVTTLDVGAALTLPVIKAPTEPGQTGLSLDVTAGYVQRNITLSEDFYEPEPTIDPRFGPFRGVSKESVVGGSAEIALIRRFGTRGRFRVARASLRGETSSYGPWRAGADVHLVETVILRAGRTENDQTSIGAGISIDGLIRALGAASNSPRRLAFGDRLTARADVGIYDVGGRFESTTFGFTLGWRP